MASPGVELAKPDDFLKDHGIRTVEVSLTDLTGALRGKRLPARAFLEGALAGEVAFSSALFAWDYGLDVFSDDLYNWATGYPDIFLRPDAGTLCLASWRPGTAFVHCDVVDEAGTAVEISPRDILRRAIAECQAAGFTPKIGLEIEFYVLDRATRLPIGQRNPVYSLHDDSHHEPLLAEIRDALDAAGIEVEACGAEYAPGQAEINLRYSDPLSAADNLMFFRYAVKQIAAKNGLLATFMAKPFKELSGSGLHVHQSLWSTDGARNLFWDGARGGVSALAEQYLAGLLARIPDTYAASVPTPNGYKRITGHSFAPTTLSWGSDNRSTAVRALTRGGRGTRLESRVAASDANPYLVVAAALLAGLAGIKDQAVPPAAATADAYESGEYARLPADLAEAVSLLRESPFAKAAFGARATELLAAVARREVALYHAEVTEWERDRYLEAV
jgi:glutamine synthetase